MAGRPPACACHVCHVVFTRRAGPVAARAWPESGTASSSRSRRRSSREAEVVFLALPEEAAATIAPTLVERGVRVIDLSGAFRLRDEASREKWYPATKLGSLQPVYGLTERNCAAISGAQLVANPGCYPTAALLALEPLAEAGLLAGDVVIDAKSGISGAGKKPSDRTHFSENHGSVSAYGVFGHRHEPEIEQELGASVTFVPHLVPLDRGILETIYARVRPGTTAANVAEVMSAAYRHAPFVRLTGESPAGDQARRLHEFLRYRVARRCGGRTNLDGVGHRQPRQGRGRPGDSESERDARLRRAYWRCCRSWNPTARWGRWS